MSYVAQRRVSGYAAKRLPAMVCFVALCTLATACGTKRAILYAERLEPTGLAPGDHITVRFREYHRDGEQPEDAERFETCLVEAMAASHPELIFRSRKEIMEALGRGDAGESVVQPEAILELLQDPADLRSMIDLGVRYIVVFGGSGYSTGHHVEFQAKPPFWGFGRTWTRNAYLLATIIDVPNRRVTGRISVLTKGDVGWFLPVFLVLPLPPIPFLALSGTEGHVCSEMGDAVAGFIVGSDEHPDVPAPADPAGDAAADGLSRER